MLSKAEIRAFEELRPDLLGLAYRILGSLADAEDAVQDTFLKWAATDRKDIQNPPGWLTATCTRRCIDLLRAAHHTRVSYVGAWLPEPIHKPVEDDPEAGYDLSSSLRMAFLLMLERLTPKERAAYLLHEIFETPYAEIAKILEIREPACRKLVSRASSHIGQLQTRFKTPADRQDELLSAFEGAIKDGSTGTLASLLSEDVRLTADGGGKVAAVLEVLQGYKAVTTFLTQSLHRYWEGLQWNMLDINGQRGVVIKGPQGIEAAVTFSYDSDGRATDIYIVRNPEKLASLAEVSIH